MIEAKTILTYASDFKILRDRDSDVVHPPVRRAFGNFELIVGVSPLRIIQGDAPGRVRAMVLEWADQHQEELLQAWDRLSVARPPLPIPPLQ